MCINHSYFGASLQLSTSVVRKYAFCTEDPRRGAEMLSFLGLRKDSSKKSTPEKEMDGFVILGETMEEQRQKMQSMNIVQPSTNVIVLPSKQSSSSNPAPPPGPAHPPGPAQPAVAMPAPVAETAASLPELLGDVPFTLAPHVLAMQAGVPQVPEILLSRDINDNLASYRYDFTLENSVLCDS
ncbi:hypothetical protein MATL_G00227870 [Megalops atlanticus]|uniref:UMA domain-containing protein n=1 Tax=Megalops atlanticus TaxID=7932 RepID=A0A9D3PGQ1_MEGAT|nr:hypothetical protein MATL_G00227870 [Megalops atlanticus]